MKHVRLWLARWLVPYGYVVTMTTLEHRRQWEKRTFGRSYS